MAVAAGLSREADVALAAALDEHWLSQPVFRAKRTAHSQ
jgi:hypothetical protein